MNEKSETIKYYLHHSREYLSTAGQKMEKAGDTTGSKIVEEAIEKTDEAIEHIDRCCERDHCPSEPSEEECPF